MSKKAIIIGAGPVGCLLSLFLNRKGISVRVFEKRQDLRLTHKDDGRSINLVITKKGIHALEELGIWDELKLMTVPVNGRMIHDLSGTLTYQPYSKDNKEANYSISRGDLNKFILNKGEARGVQFHFSKELEKIDFQNRFLGFKDMRPENKTDFDLLFGADGVSSVVRNQLIQHLKLVKDIVHEENLPLGVDYKELFLPALEDGKYPIDQTCLHIWPRGDFMLMALPNLGGSFTLTLYLPEQGEYSFSKFNNPTFIKKFFEEKFPDITSSIQNLERDFLANPIGRLSTVRCHPWHYRGDCLLMGDAAHGIVPFFGQGMNAGFEDCSVLNALIEKTPGPNINWEEIFGSFYLNHKENADAIADMAIENYFEMGDKTADEKFLFRKEVEGKIARTFPNLYLSRYSMVVHTTIPYRVAKEAGKIQEKILNELCQGITSTDQVDLKNAENLINKLLTPYLLRNGITFR